MLLGTLAQTVVDVAIPKPEHIPEVTGNELVSGTLNLLFIILGLISLIVIVIQGIRYSLSSGDSKQTTEARNGIIYALVGLAVATSAWSIVNFTLNKVIRDTSLNAETSTIINLIGDIVGFMIFIGAIIALIMIFVAAIKFNVSGGDAKKVTDARNTIIYALVGLVICIAAGPVLAFVLDKL